VGRKQTMNILRIPPTSSPFVSNTVLRNPQFILLPTWQNKFHTCKKQRKSLYFRILIFMSLDTEGEDKILNSTTAPLITNYVQKSYFRSINYRLFNDELFSSISEYRK